MHSAGSETPRPLRRLALHLAVLAAIAVAPHARAARVVATGDVHGDIPALTQVLGVAAVLDASGSWIAGDALVVQVGDLLDRGPQLRAALDFAIALEAKAAAAGGRYVLVLGNHEVMNLVGDLRYVTDENYAEFADSRSAERRDDAWREQRKWLRRRSERLGLAQPDLGSEAKQEWMAAHPLGFLEHREMFAPEGRYGRWLRQRTAVLVAERSLFVHGGLSPALADRTPEAIAGRVREEIAQFDALRAQLIARGLALPHFDLVELVLAMREEIAALDRRAEAARVAGEAFSPTADDVERRRLAEAMLGWDGWSIHAEDGPLWFRDYSRWSDEEAAERTPPLLAAWDVDRIVVGHTPQPNGRVRSRAGGGLLLIDSGMNAEYVKGGRGSALEIFDGTVTAIYADGSREELARAAAPATDEKPGREAPEETGETAVPSTADDETATARVAGARVWLDRQGQPLPFADDDELLDFLANAEVIDDEPIGEGITRPHRLTLERDGVRVRASFRDVEERRQMAYLDHGRREPNFRDYYGFEPAAYRLGRLLGIDNIPPSTIRKVKGKRGSVQFWIERAMTEKKRLETGDQPSDPQRWQREMKMMRLWDDLVGNTDRNQGNLLFDADWKLWLIDHTRSFRNSVDLMHSDKITWCERGFYEKLRTVTDDEIRRALSDEVRATEIRAVLQRRDKLVALLETLVRERGADTVLFDWAE